MKRSFQTGMDGASITTQRGLVAGPTLAPRMLEKQVEATCSDFLELDGWRTLKTDPVSNAGYGKGFGELGMADRLYIRYSYQTAYGTAPAEVLWIEWKRPKGAAKSGACRKCGVKPEYARDSLCGRAGTHSFSTPPAGKAAAHQIEWAETERVRGALVWVAGKDFEPSIDGFMRFYKSSGLARNIR